MSTWWDFVKARLERTGMTQMALAAEIGADKSVVTDWKKGAKAGSKYARAVAHVFGDPEIDALIAAGHVVLNPAEPAPAEPTQETTTPHTGDVDLSTVPDELILREVAARMRRSTVPPMVVRPDTRDDYEIAGRHHTPGRVFTDAEQDFAAERPDDEGPEHGA